MKTNGEVIAKIRNLHKFLSKDNKLSDRWILSEAKDIVRRLIKQNNNLLKIYKSDEMFQHIPCIPLMKVDVSECCSVKVGKYVARSIDRIPEIETGIYGELVQRVTSIGGDEFSKTTARNYENLLNLKYANNKQYYWIKDGYLYISNSEIEKVNLSAIFIDYKGDVEDCSSPYDSIFRCPEWLLDEMIEVLNKQFLNLHNFKIDNEVDNKDA